MKRPSRHIIAQHMTEEQIYSAFSRSNERFTVLPKLAHRDGGPYVIQTDGLPRYDSNYQHKHPQDLTGKVQTAIQESYVHWQWYRLEVQESDGENGQVRTAHYADWNTVKWSFSVRSDQEVYTDFDSETILVAMTDNRFTVPHPVTGFDEHWFFVRGHAVDWWLPELAFMFTQIRRDKERIARFYRALSHGCVAHPDMIDEVERMLEDHERDLLNTFRDRLSEKRVLTAQSNALYKFWYADAKKARVGVWRLEKLQALNLTENSGELGAGSLESQLNELVVDDKKIVRASNGHATFEFAWVGVIGSLESMNESDLLRTILGVPNNAEEFDPRKKSVDNTFYLKINGIRIPFEYKFHRLHVFGRPLKKTELIDILVECACYRNVEEMESLVFDCARLSLTYRRYLAEGINRVGMMTWREATHNSYNYVGNDVVSNLFGIKAEVRAFRMANESNNYRCLVSGELPMRFDVVRRRNGGLALTHLGKEYPVYPDDLLKNTTSNRSIFAVVSKALENSLEGLTDEERKKLVKGIVWMAVRRARVADFNSRKLLKEVCDEIGAVKESLRIENKTKQCYVITGTSGTRYAVEDVPGKCPIYREDTDSHPAVWRFVCIEATGDVMQERGKDNLVTRLYALLDDVESSKDIATLAVGKVASALR